MGSAKMKRPGDRGHSVLFFFQLDFSKSHFQSRSFKVSLSKFFQLYLSKSLFQSRSFSLLLLFLLFRHVTDQLGLFWKPTTKPDVAQNEGQNEAQNEAKRS